MTFILKFYILLLSITLSLSAIAQFSPTPDSMSYNVTFDTDNIIQLENVYGFGEEYTGKRQVDIPRYYRRAQRLIRQYGGELAAVFDIYDVAEGVKRPRYSALVRWPSIQTFRAYRSDPRYGKISAEIHTDRVFFSVASTTIINFNTDLNYEIFSGTISPVNGSKLATFFERVPGTFGPGYSRNQVMQFVPMDIPENTFNIEFGGLVEWPSINHIKLFVDAIKQSDLDLRNAAVERIDQYNGRVLPRTWYH